MRLLDLLLLSATESVCSFSDIEGTISFIATKCDDVSCQEVINSLELDNEPELQEIESRLDQIHDESREWKEKKTNAERAAKRKSTPLIPLFSHR